MFVTMQMQTFLLLFMEYSPTLRAVIEKPTSQSPAVASDKCILPSYPEHGTYVVLDNTTASFDQALQITAIRYLHSCEPGYQVEPSDNVVVCHEGVWYNKTPRCKLHSPTVTAVVEKPTSPTPAVASDKCILPSYPEHGTYVVLGNTTASPDQALQVTAIRYSCEPGYHLEPSKNVVVCHEGVWYNEIPRCKRFCHLERHPGVEYQCLIDKYENSTGHRECEQDEPEGTVIRPLCKEPSFFSPVPLKSMTCVDGIWDSNPTCTSECGTVPPKGTSLIFGDAYNNLFENNLPWHTLVYKTTVNHYDYMYDGSLVTDSVIISAAYGFFKNNKLLAASEFAVAVGKLYLEWDNLKDTRSQKSDIREIKIPAGYQGAPNYQDNIALIFVKSPFQFSINIRPACLDFDYAFDNHQLQSGNIGKLTCVAPEDDSSENLHALKVVDVAYLDSNKCNAQVSSYIRHLLTSDKICTNFMNDTGTVVKYHHGSGLVFPENQQGVQRYYLRGVATGINANIWIFTYVLKHEIFIKENIKFNNIY